MVEFNIKLRPDPVQRQSIALFLAFVSIIVPLLFITVSRFNKYIAVEQETQKMTLRINILKRDPLLENYKKVPTPELLVDLEKIKEIAANYALEFSGSEVLENEAMTKSFSLQLKGSYLAFLRFLYAYCEKGLAYRFEEINVHKKPELLFELKFKLQEKV